MSSKNKGGTEEKELALKINSMLLSPDKEMREMGRNILTHTKVKDKMLKAFLLINSSKQHLESQGINYFMRLKKEVRTLEDFIHLFKASGYTTRALVCLYRIQAQYDLIKKMGNYFSEEVDLVKDILDGTQAVNERISSYGYKVSMSDEESTDKY